MANRLDPTGRRELVRLMLEEGLPPRAAAARLGVSESTARRWRARADEVLPPAATAKRPTRDTQALIEPLLAVPPRKVRERPIRDTQALIEPLLAVPPRKVRERPIRDTQALIEPLLAVPPRKVRERPPRPRPVERAPVVRPGPEGGSAASWTRGRLGGVALTLAFMPVGWFVSAAVFGGGAVAGQQPLFGDAPPPSAEERFTPALAAARRRARGTTLAAHVRGRSVMLHRSRGGKRIGRLRARRIEGQRVPLVLLVQRRRGGWLRVRLPVRPNGSLAWIRARDARLRVNPYRVSISLKRHRLELYRYGRRIATRRVGVGLSFAPTPTGKFFITDLIKTRNPQDLYGPYAFGLSAFSAVNTSFRGGNGQIGIHGTNQPEALGTDVSQGCIRVGNRTITAFAKMLPLGTPVDIRRD